MFLADGLAETGIASIMSAAGLTQGGFYRHFGPRSSSSPKPTWPPTIACSSTSARHWPACRLARPWPPPWTCT
jgi:hypothetical protein